MTEALGLAAPPPPTGSQSFAASPATQPDRVETRVYLRQQCLLGEEKKVEPTRAIVAALAAIFVPALIEKGLDAVSSALRKAGDKQTLRDSGKYPTYLYRLSYDPGKQAGKLSLNSDLGCAIVVRGKFSGPDPDYQSEVSFPEPGLFLGSDQEGKRVARLNASNIPVKELAAEYEAAITTADDGTALKYDSRFLEIKAFQGSRSSENRTLVVSFTFAAAGAKEDETTLSLALMDLGEIKRGTVMGPGQLSSRRSGWLGGLAASDASTKAAGELAMGPGKTFGIMPVTFEGMLIETEEGNAALVFIADVLSSAKSEAAKALSSAILPAERQKAAQAQVDELEKLRGEEEEAYGKYLSASDDLAQLKPDVPESTKAIKRFNVETAKRIWCGKYSTLRNLGIAPSGRQCP
ncbi:MAG: hypothetical protein LAO31_21985 [Acidobacteriia bacterium]|nr:hypothetical protein [Terriglobia bacterium]